MAARHPPDQLVAHQGVGTDVEPQDLHDVICHQVLLLPLQSARFHEGVDVGVGDDLVLNFAPAQLANEICTIGVRELKIKVALSYWLRTFDCLTTNNATFVGCAAFQSGYNRSGCDFYLRDAKGPVLLEQERARLLCRGADA